MEELPRRNPGSEECDGRVCKAIHEEVFLEVATVYGSTLGALRTETSTWESKQEKVNVRSDGGGNKSYIHLQICCDMMIFFPYNMMPGNLHLLVQIEYWGYCWSYYNPPKIQCKNYSSVL